MEDLSVSQSTTSLYVLVLIVSTVSCVVRVTANSTNYYTICKLSMHLILNDRAECIARVNGARGLVRVESTFGRELNYSTFRRFQQQNHRR